VRRQEIPVSSVRKRLHDYIQQEDLTPETPQRAVLSNPALRLFVSPAGANSTMEALYWGCAILSLPFMLDQPYYAGQIGQGRRLAARSAFLQQP
jgi:hypothetical protein